MFRYSAFIRQNADTAYCVTLQDFPSFALTTTGLEALYWARILIPCGSLSFVNILRVDVVRSMDNWPTNYQSINQSTKYSMEQFRFILPSADWLFTAYCWTQNVMISLSLGTLNDQIEKVIHLKICVIEIKRSTFRVFLSLPKILEAFNILYACISHLSHNCYKFHSTYIRSFDNFINILFVQNERSQTLSNSLLLIRNNVLNTFLYMTKFFLYLGKPLFTPTKQWLNFRFLFYLREIRM